MTRRYRSDAKWVCPIEIYACGIEVFCSKNKVASHFSIRTLKYHRHNFPWARLISRQTYNPCPSYSQDPTPKIKGYLKDRVCENNPQTKEDIIRREVRWIPQKILNRAVDKFNVGVASVLPYSSVVHEANIVLITEKV